MAVSCKLLSSWFCAGGVLLLSLAPGAGAAALFEIRLEGTYDGAIIDGVGGLSDVPFAHTILYDTDLDTNDTVYLPGTPVPISPDRVFGEAFHAYSASGIVALDVSIGSYSFGLGTVDTRDLATGLSSPVFYLNDDLETGNPTGIRLRLEEDRNTASFGSGGRPPAPLVFDRFSELFAVDLPIVNFGNTQSTLTVAVQAIPEPRAALVFGLGLGVVAFATRAPRLSPRRNASRAPRRGPRSDPA